MRYETPQRSSLYVENMCSAKLTAAFHSCSYITLLCLIVFFQFGSLWNDGCVFLYCVKFEFTAVKLDSVPFPVRYCTDGVSTPVALNVLTLKLNECIAW
jgi:hypothetical protein